MLNELWLTETSQFPTRFPTVFLTFCGKWWQRLVIKVAFGWSKPRKSKRIQKTNSGNWQVENV